MQHNCFETIKNKQTASLSVASAQLPQTNPQGPGDDEFVLTKIMVLTKCLSAVASAQLPQTSPQGPGDDEFVLTLSVASAQLPQTNPQGPGDDEFVLTKIMWKRAHLPIVRSQHQRKIHHTVTLFNPLRSGFLSAADCFFATRLVSSYGEFTSSFVARKLFDEIFHRNSFLWNAMLRSHCRAQQWVETLRLLRRMAAKPSDLDAFTLPIALKACAALSELRHGRTIHAVAVKTDFYHSDVYVAAALVEMYAKCCKMEDAILVFDGLRESDVVLWTSVISGYLQNGDAERAIAFFSRMVLEKHAIPDPVTLVSVVSSLGQLGDLRRGRCCHGFLLRMGFFHDISLMNSLLSFYSKMGEIKIAGKLFETMPETDVISWSCMISCYAHNGEPIVASMVYKRMIEKGLQPNSVTMVGALQACSLSRDLPEGRKLHGLAIQLRFELDKSVATSLIYMYMNCSCYTEAINLFYRLPNKDVVTWAATIDGCAKNGFADESLKLFKAMLLDDLCPDAVTMVKVLVACSHLAFLCQAHCLHGYLIRSGFSDKVYVASALLDLYSKCGSLDDAVKVFEGSSEKDVVLWSSMVAGYGINGFGYKAIETFEYMVESSIKPNSITFISVLSVCSHNGMVEEGRRIFGSMIDAYGVTPESEHYCIMVDLLARTGKLHEALNLIEEVPMQTDPHVWCALLSGCKLHEDFKLGDLVAQRLLEIDPTYSGYYNLMANMYAFGGRWNNVEVVKRWINERRLRKMPGYSTVEIGSEIHT
ncbi:putative pentatricopeptide repeat-containing protein At3g01580 [Phalaenopsis equestris]|uniref:putative pentatricopeptide repeat-containing protein At3g01580 n=1 Tax=Phalaenopsis equestris TaxID=78828 RepID=UPI0009E5CF0E|nr:putative pentatricopeptide repeat-containing protein At3g01580 [Phalaenopsis equestris]